MDGIVKIHGKEYKTVAKRVSEFRENHPDWTIQTDLVSADNDTVIMFAAIFNEQERLIGTGYAEENRAASQINRTSALENCETSAIGRALAACGYAGTEYASANEVENAIHQQKEPAKHETIDEPIDEDRVNKAVQYFKDVIDSPDDGEDVRAEAKEMWHKLPMSWQKAVHTKMGNEKAPDSKRMYRTLLDEYTR